MPSHYIDLFHIPGFKAGGSVYPSRFVRQVVGTNKRVVQCVAGEQPLGIAQLGQKDFPIAGAAAGVAAASGDILQIYGPGCVGIILELGGTVVAGDFVGPDANGKGVRVDPRLAGAIALEGGASGEFIEVVVVEPRRQFGGVYATYSDNATLTAADSGKNVVMTGVDKTLTLPLPAGQVLEYTFVLAAAGLSVGTGLTVAIPAGATMIGNGFTPADAKGAVLAGSGDRAGDTLTVRSIDGTNYYIVGVTGTWTRVA